MTREQLEVFLASVSAVASDSGGFDVPADQHVTLCVAHDGVGLTVSKVEAVHIDGEMVRARTRKGETYLLAISDVFAAAFEAAKGGERKAGFGVDR